MRKNLIKAHELIQTIQANFKNPKKLRENCAQLEDLIEYIDPDSKYHYMLLLVQINATKLRDFGTAQSICKKVMQDCRPSVELQGTLRLSFIHALQHKYNQAIKILEQANQMSAKKPELQLTFINYCQRLFNYSKQSHLLNGQKCQRMQKFQEAIKHYNLQFQSQVVQDQIQNKYFAAKTILQLLQTFPPNTFKNIDCKKYQNYQKQLYQQKYQRQDQNIIQKLNQNYLNQKNYIKKIVELLQQKQMSMKIFRDSSKAGISNKANLQIDQKRILAVLKIKNVLNTEKDLDKNLREEFQNCLKEFKNSNNINYNMLNQFTTKQIKIVNRGYQIIRRTFLSPCFQVLKSLKNQVKEKAPKKNRFVNQPKIQSSQQDMFRFKAAMSQTISQIGDITNFTGSFMQKINQTSEGHQTRYFYFNRDELNKGKLKLYYNKKKSSNYNQDDYYQIKKYNGLFQGKQTKALQRSQCDKFQPSKCFSISYQGNKTKNFYVPDKKDYDKWVLLLKKYQRDLNKQIMKSKSPAKQLNQTTKQKQKEKQIQLMKATKMRKTVFFG